MIVVLPAAQAIEKRVAIKLLFISDGNRFHDHYHDSVDDAFAYAKSMVDMCTIPTPAYPEVCVTLENLRPDPSYGDIRINGSALRYLADIKVCGSGSCSTGIGLLIGTQLQCPQQPISFGAFQANYPEPLNRQYVCQAYIPDPEPCGDCDAKGNPIHPGTGQKLQREADYQSAANGGLQFQRTYRSDKGFFASAVTSGFVDNTVQGATSQGCYPGSFTAGSQTFNYCFPYVGTGAQSYRLEQPNGRSILFSGPPNAITAKADVNDKVTQRTNAAGAIEWDIRHPDDSTDTYTTQGALIHSVQRDGHQLNYTYSDATTPANIAPRAGLLISISDAYGRSLNFSYDSNGRMIQMLDPAGGLYQYGYADNGNLTTVSYPDGKTRTYLYNEAAQINNGTACGLQPNGFPSALTGIVDENNVRYATFAYNCTGRAVSTEHAGGNDKYSFAYTIVNGVSNSTVITDPLGTQRTQAYQLLLDVNRPTSQSQPGGSGCGPAASNQGYDPNSNVAYRVDFNGHRTNYVYDLTRNLETSRTEGLTAAGSTTPETRTIATTWDPTWRLPTQTVEKNATGVALRQTDTTYDSQGNKTSQSIKDIASGVIRTTTWTTTYNPTVPGAVDRLVITGPRSDVSDTTTIDYWPPDATCTGSGAGYDKGCRGQIKQTTNALGQVTQYTRYNPHGQIEQIVDPNGLTTTLSYDARQRLTTRSSSDGSSTQTTQYQYDGVGQLTQITQADGSTLTYSYDAAHRLTRITDSLGNHIDYTLDAMGNRTNESKVDPTGNLTQSLSRTIDALNRVQNIVGQ